MEKSLLMVCVKVCVIIVALEKVWLIFLVNLALDYIYFLLLLLCLDALLFLV